MECQQLINISRSTKIIKRMSKWIKLVSPEDEKLFIVSNHVADVCRSQTIIYSPGGFSVYRIFDLIDNLEINNDRIRINYSSGAYLLIKP